MQCQKAIKSSCEVAIMFAVPVSAVLVFATRTCAAVGFTCEFCAETQHSNRLNRRQITMRTVEISEDDRHARRYAEEICELRQLWKDESGVFLLLLVWQVHQRYFLFCSANFCFHRHEEHQANTRDETIARTHTHCMARAQGKEPSGQ